MVNHVNSVFVIENTCSSMVDMLCTSDGVGLLLLLAVKEEGFREIASGPRCHFPGQCLILNWKYSVFSLKLEVLGFDIVFSSRSLKMSSKGLWLVATSRILQTKT